MENSKIMMFPEYGNNSSIDPNLLLASDISQFVNTAIHEAKHVQSHVCSYYNIDEDSEEAAYLIGYIVQRMYKMFAKIVKQYV